MIVVPEERHVVGIERRTVAFFRNDDDDPDRASLWIPCSSQVRSAGTDGLIRLASTMDGRPVLKIKEVGGEFMTQGGRRYAYRERAYLLL